MGEFDLIRQYFLPTSSASLDASVHLGIGDDCAIIDINDTEYLAISSDTLVEKVHFFENADPYLLAQKALAVAFSDLAAMGVDNSRQTKPKCLVSLTLPEMNQQWLEDYSKGVGTFCKSYHCALVGGDTTKGPLAISVTVFATIQKEKVLKRSAAKVGDAIFVSGKLGSAAAAVRSIQQQEKLDQAIQTAYDQPTPRFDIARSIGGYSQCAIDISDGLLADLTHICEASRTSAHIDAELLPLDKKIRSRLGDTAISLALSGGDDYQLCFTIPSTKIDAFNAVVESQSWDVTQIGSMREQASDGSVVIVKNAPPMTHKLGYDHFA